MKRGSFVPKSFFPCAKSFEIRDRLWDYVIKKSVSDESTKAVAWWTKELTDKCTGYLTRTLSYDQVIADGSTLLVTGEPPRG